jgi:uncharacterized RDD family membrane protein YckC
VTTLSPPAREPAPSGWAAYLVPEPQWEAPADQRFAGLIFRAVAFLVDASVLAGFWGFVVLSPAVRQLSEPLAALFPLIGPLLYFPFAWARFGTTIGLRVLRLRIFRSTDGTRIGYGAAIIRMITVMAELAALFTFVPGLLVVLPVLRDRRRRSLHDRAAGTVVVRRLR